MPLSAGTRIGPYVIEASLGAGGMGEVYRARDTRLDRDVAIKLLPDLLARDPDALSRFEREAKAVAALSHPNILAIHEFASANDVVYAVTELLEGETLRERLASGPIAPRRAVDLALQIARGLAAAHDRGIVHRDLKPENIFITRDNVVKILDFGIAKVRTEESSSGETRSLATTPGVVMGTVAYMSPEQARGGATDARSDLFSFGVVLYEMLGGRRPFGGDTTQETIAALLRDDPPDLPAGHIPAALERVVRRALEKNPHDRFQTAADLAFALENVVGATATTFTTAIPSADAGRRPVRSRRLVTGTAVLAAAALLVALGVVSARWLVSRPAPITYRQLTFQRGFISAARFAPDGHTILYSASWGDGPMRVYSTRSDVMESQPLSVPNAKLLSATMPGEMTILVRPYEMGTWVARGTLARAPVVGGAPREIAEDVTDADVTSDGAKFALVRQTGTYFRLEFPAGTVLYESSGYLSNPRISPGGDRVAFFEHPTFPDDRGFVAVVENGNTRRLTDEWATLQGLAWTPDGGELWFGATIEGDRSIHAVDLSGRQRIVWNGPTSLIIQDIARDGRVLVAQETNRYEIAGRQAGDPRDRGLNDFSLEGLRALARDGTAFVSELYGVSGGQDYAAYLKKFDGSPAVRLGTGSPEDISPDGRWVATRLFSAPDRLVLLPTGAGDSRVLQLGKVRLAGTDVLQARWTADGRHILFIGTEDGRSLGTYRIDLQGGPPQAVTPAGVIGTLLSPDGRTLVVRDASKGVWSVMPFGAHPAPATPIRGLERAEAPMQWTSDGRGLFVFERGRLPAAIVRLDPTTGERTVWKELAVPDAAGAGGLISVHITPDGGTYVFNYQRILVLLYLVTGLR